MKDIVIILEKPLVPLSSPCLEYVQWAGNQLKISWILFKMYFNIAPTKTNLVPVILFHWWVFIDTDANSTKKNLFIVTSSMLLKRDKKKLYETHLQTQVKWKIWTLFNNWFSVINNLKIFYKESQTQYFTNFSSFFCFFCTKEWSDMKQSFLDKRSWIFLTNIVTSSKKREEKKYLLQFRPQNYDY